MVTRVLKIVYKEVRGLHFAAYVLALFTFGSQILALVRDRILAHTFGAGADLDIYYTAFRIPDLMYVLFASTLSVYVLIPFVVRHQHEYGDKEAQTVLGQVFTVFLICYSILAFIIFIFAPFLVPILFPGFNGNSELLITVIRVMLLQPFLLGISSLFGVVTQLSHRFVLYALSPIVYNLGIILGIVFLYPAFGLVGLGVGVVIGAFAHMAIQIPFVRNSTLSFKITRQISWSKMREILAISLPRAFTLSIHQITLLVIIGMASIMTVGSVSVFQFAYNLQSVPLAIIGVSYSVAAFPLLVQNLSKGNMNQFITYVITALRHIIFWSVPAIALIIVLRAQIVRVLLGSGEFDWSDTKLTAAVLALLALSLTAQALILFVVRVFYAGGYTKIPFFAGLFGALTSIGMSYSFYYLYTVSEIFSQTLNSIMRIENIHGSEVVVLGLGYAASLIIHAIVLLVLLYRIFKIPKSGMTIHFLRSLGASFIGGISAYGALNFFSYGINPQTFVGIFVQGLLAGLVGIFGVILTYYVFRTPELHEIYKAFHKRIFKTDVVKPEIEII